MGWFVYVAWFARSKILRFDQDENPGWMELHSGQGVGYSSFTSMATIDKPLLS